MGGPSSESGNSSSSFGSGIESDASSSAAALKPGTYDDEGAPALSFEAGVFGVLYTVSKEKAPRLWFVIFRLFLDWLQLFLLIVNPSYGWAIDPSNKVWQAFSFIQLNYFMTARGYLFFLVCLYTMSGCLVTNLALCIWVSKSFQANKFDHVWPIAWLKVFSLVFYQVLDIASLTLFLIALDCQYFAVPASALYHNQQFPDVYCWSMPHLAHAAVAAVSVVVFTVLAAVFTGAEVELNPVSKNLLGMAHSQVEVMAFLLKSLMTCASVFVNGMTWLSVVYLICSFFLVYLYLTWLPYLHAAINHVRIAAMTSILYASLLLIIMSYAPGVNQNNPKEVADFNGILTNLLWAGLVPVTLAGAAMSYIHTRFWAVTVVNKFREAPPDAKLHRVYPFTDPRQVEIASRCCRQWLDEDTLDEEAGRLAERIILAGKKLMPHQPYMTIWYSSFLIDVQGSYQSGYTELQLAKKATNPTYLERFCMFIREQEHTQRASAVTSGENGSVDLVSYVEFQRNLRLAVRMHMDALLAMRNFWETLLHANITFDKLSRAVARIEMCVRASERMYRTVLSRHSSSVKVLQLYVKFLQGVRNDPWSAARWAAEAEKLQKMEEEANERAVFGGDDTELGGMSRNDDTKGIIIMGANCLIRMINDAACELVGYQYKSELMGKNINAIVPPPFSRNHNNYVRNYIQTGQSKVLDKLREFVVLHKERYVRPISVFVTKVSGIGEDSVFMGVFQPIPIPPNTAVLWVLMSGQVLSCDITFTDWTGYKQEDLTGKPIIEMVQQPEELERTMMYVRSETEARQHKKGSHDMPRPATTAHSLSAKTDHTNLQALVCGVSDVSFKHLYTDELLTVDAEVKIGGISETALWVITVKRAAPATSKLMVTDSRGRILHVTQALADCLGTTPAKLQLSRKSHALDTLLPAPFTRLHHQWYQSKAEVIPPWSCRSGLSVYLPASSPAGPFMHPVSLHFTTRELPGKEPMNVVAFQDSSFEQVLDERRLRLLLDSKGRVLAAGDSSISLFNLDPQALVGLPLTHILDVLRPKARDDDPLNHMKDDASAAAALMDMANRSFSTPGLSWRVGVAPIMDPDKLAALGPIGMAMIARKTVPAIMTVEPHLDGGHMEGASVMLPAEMHLMVELWRADLMSGVLELDTQGSVVQLGVKEQPVYSPHLLLGYPASMLQGAAISALLPTVGKAHLEALFTEGSMGKALGKPGVGRPGKGGMAKGGFHRRRAVGPVHHVKLLHGTDGAELEVQVQAVVKQDVGAGCALYLILHLEQPRCGREDFRSWLPDSPLPTLESPAARQHAQQRPASRRMSHVQRTSNLSQGFPVMTANYDSPALAKQSWQPSWVLAADQGTSLDYSQDDWRLRRLHPASEQQPSMEGLKLDSPDPSSHAPNKHYMHKSNKVVPESSHDLGHVKFKSSYQANPALAAAQLLQGAWKEPSPEGTPLPIPWVNGTNGVRRRGSGRLQGVGEPGKLEGSVLSGLYEVNGQAHVDAWIDAPGQPATPPLRGSASGSLDDREAAGVEEVDLQPEEAAGDEDEDASVIEDLTEAGEVMNEYKRGKRLKKLVKMLGGPTAMTSVLRFKWLSLGLVAVLLLVDIVMFVVVNMLVQKQANQVADLSSASMATHRVLELGICVASLGTLYAGDGSSNLRYLGEGGVENSITQQLAMMETYTEDLDRLHTGLYRGFGQQRRLPDSFGIRGLWEHPSLPVVSFFNVDIGIRANTSIASLWDMGNLYIKSAHTLLQNSRNKYGNDTQTGRTFVQDVDTLFMFENLLRGLIPGYAATLDGLMQVAIQDSKKVNNMQLVILALEGGIISTVAIIVMWSVTAAVVFRRYAIYCVFLLVPHGLVKGLATKPLGIKEDGASGEEGAEGDDGAPAAEAQDMGGDDEGGQSVRTRGPATSGTGFHLHLAMAQQAAAKPRSFWAQLLFWKTNAEDQGGRRTLKASLGALLYVVWPFMLWGVFVVLINAVGYVEVARVTSPIATANLAQFMKNRAKGVMYLSQRLVYGQAIDSTHGQVLVQPYPLNGTSAQDKAYFRAVLQLQYQEMRKEYDALLYGREAPLVAGDPSPHFQLATQGVMFAEGADILYTARGCMAQLPADCQPATSPYFLASTNGLDQTLKGLFYAVEHLLMQTDQDVQGSWSFEYIYEVGNADVTGGLMLLSDDYDEYVQSVYRESITLHVVTMVVCLTICALFLLFILRPYTATITSEGRRVAELLSSLPAELEVETLVSGALKASIIEDPLAAIALAAAQKEEVSRLRGTSMAARSGVFRSGGGSAWQQGQASMV